MKKYIINLSFLILLIGSLLFIFYPRTPHFIIGIEDSQIDSLKIEILVDNVIVFDDYINKHTYEREIVPFQTSLGNHEVVISSEKYNISFSTSIFFIFNDRIRLDIFSPLEKKSVRVENLFLSTYRY